MKKIFNNGIKWVGKVTSSKKIDNSDPNPNAQILEVEADAGAGAGAKKQYIVVKVDLGEEDPAPTDKDGNNNYKTVEKLAPVKSFFSPDGPVFEKREFTKVAINPATSPISDGTHKNLASQAQASNGAKSK